MRDDGVPSRSCTSLIEARSIKLLFATTGSQFGQECSEIGWREVEQELRGARIGVRPGYVGRNQRGSGRVGRRDRSADLLRVAGEKLGAAGERPAVLPVQGHWLAGLPVLRWRREHHGGARRR